MKASATAVLMLARPVDAGRTAHAWLEAGFREILVIHNGDADGGLVDAPVRALRLPKGSSPGPAIMEGARLARERECQALLIATDGLGPEEGQRLLAAAGEDWPRHGARRWNNRTSGQPCLGLSGAPGNRRHHHRRRLLGRALSGGAAGPAPISRPPALAARWNWRCAAPGPGCR